MLLLPVINPVLPHVPWSQRNQGHIVRSEAQCTVSSNSQYCSLDFCSVTAPQTPDMCVCMPDCSARVQLSFFSDHSRKFPVWSESCSSVSTRKLTEAVLFLLDFQMLDECYNFTCLKSVLSQAPNASWATNCCNFKLEMLRETGNISRNV